MKKEIWKDIPEYEGKYQVSNLGNVKSLNYNNTKLEKLLRQQVQEKYSKVVLRLNGKPKTKKVHKLVAMAFLNHIPCQHKIIVDHINNNSLDNRLINLQLISQRLNISKDVKNKSSNYTGVSFDKNRKKWLSQIVINNKNKFLGRFKTELEASIIYQKKLKEIQNENKL